MKFRFPDFLAIAVISLISLWALFPLSLPGLPNTHDGQAHIVRIASFSQALVDGQFPPRWAGNLAFGYGSPVLSFNFPLPYLIGEIFHLAGFSFIDSTKLVFALGYLISGLAMFLFLKKITDRLSAFAGSVLYLLAPYRFLDIFVRGDTGESMVFLFPPLILWLLWDVKKIEIKKIIFASMLTGAMFLTHQIMAIVFTGALFIIFALKKNIKFYLLSVFLGIGIASFNFLPLIFEKHLTNLDLLSLNNFQNQFPKITSILYSRWNWGPAAPLDPSISMSFQLGLAQWLAIFIFTFITLFNLLKKKTKEIQLNLIVLGLLAVVIYLITPYSQFLWERIYLLQIILYPWRLLGLGVFLSSIAAGLTIHYIKTPVIKVLLVFLLTVVSLYANRNHNQVNGRTLHSDQYYLAYPGSSDMWGEFLPKGTKIPEDLPNNKVEFKNERASLISLEEKSNLINFAVETDEDTKATVNVFDYPGWQVKIKDRVIEKEENSLISFNIPTGYSEVEVAFKETPVRKLADALTIITIVTLVVLYSKNRLKK